MNFRQYFDNIFNEKIKDNHQRLIEEIKTLTDDKVIKSDTMTDFVDWKVKSFLVRKNLPLTMISEIVKRLKEKDLITLSQFIIEPSRQNICESTQHKYLKEVKGLNIIILPKQKKSKSSIVLSGDGLETKTLDAKINGILTFMKIVKGKNGGFQDNVFKEATEFSNIATKYYKDTKFIILADIFPFPGQEHINGFERYKTLESKNVKVFNSDTINKESI